MIKGDPTVGRPRRHRRSTAPSRLYSYTRTNKTVRAETQLRNDIRR